MENKVEVVAKDKVWVTMVHIKGRPDIDIGFKVTKEKLSFEKMMEFTKETVKKAIDLDDLGTDVKVVSEEEDSMLYEFEGVEDHFIFVMMVQEEIQ